MITVGIDVGVKRCKIIVLVDGSVKGSASSVTGLDEKKGIETAFDLALSNAGISKADINKIVSTGMGAKLAEMADENITVNIADAIGMNQLAPTVRTIIDVGAEEGRVIVCENGKVTNYTLNDRCAAGAGIFADAMARVLEVDVDTFGKMALEATNPASISAQCTVFAESEVISMVASDKTKEDIARSVVDAIAERTAALAHRLTVEPDIAFIGGSARNAGLVQSLTKALDLEKLIIPEDPDFVGALGAAIVAAQRV
jgi:predicted CoA-substrate-specific enzyme activase